MNKSFFLTALTLLNTIILLVLMAFYFFKDDHIAYVDSSKLISNYKGMQGARKVNFNPLKVQH